MLKELSAVWQPFQPRAKRSSHADPLAKRSSQSCRSTGETLESFWVPRAKRSSQRPPHYPHFQTSARLSSRFVCSISRSAAVQFVRCLVSVFCFCSRSPAWFQRTAADWAALSSSLLHPWSISSLAVSAQFNVMLFSGTSISAPSSWIDNNQCNKWTPPSQQNAA